jgi:hypothetical protein
MFESDEMAQLMSEAGAVAYLTKDRASEDLCDVIRRRGRGRAGVI